MYSPHVVDYFSATVVCAWGELGAWAQQGKNATLLHSPAFPPPQVVDSLGAGDTFTAAMIASQSSGFDIVQSLELACRLAGSKVGQRGLEGLTSTWTLAVQEIKQ